MNIVAFLVIGQSEKVTERWLVRGFGSISKELDSRVCLPRLQEPPGSFYVLGSLSPGRRVVDLSPAAPPASEKSALNDNAAHKAGNGRLNRRLVLKLEMWLGQPALKRAGTVSHTSLIHLQSKDYFCEFCPLRQQHLVWRASRVPHPMPPTVRRRVSPRWPCRLATDLAQLRRLQTNALKTV
jgi:hypothetical protein